MTRRPLPVPSPRAPLALLLGALLLGGCDAPDPAPDDGVPDPQAQAAAPAAAPAEDATELRDAIDEPLDKARAVEAAGQARDAETRADLEEAGG